MYTRAPLNRVSTLTVLAILTEEGLTVPRTEEVFSPGSSETGFVGLLSLTLYLEPLYSRACLCREKWPGCGREQAI